MAGQEQKTGGVDIRESTGSGSPPDSWVLSLTGDWVLDGSHPGLAELTDRLSTSETGHIVVDGAGLGTWDTSVAATLFGLRTWCQDRGIEFEVRNLPALLAELLRLATPPGPRLTKGRQPSILEYFGLAAKRGLASGVAVLQLLGDIGKAAWAGLRGKAHIRKADLGPILRQSGAAALPIVTIVNLLVGGILAFVGAVQLRQFGAEIYLANLVGIAMAREMAAIMTAIIMAGRTGAAFAAHIATMQGNEEIDALRTLGVSPIEHLVLPRTAALILMMPVLYLYGAAVGILGGFLVAWAVLDITALSYLTQTRLAVPVNEFIIGLLKSFSFGALIGLVSCHVGLKAGRSAADVGIATTSAVVTSIVGVIALDAIYAVAINMLGL